MARFYPPRPESASHTRLQRAVDWIQGAPGERLDEAERLFPSRQLGWIGVGGIVISLTLLVLGETAGTTLPHERTAFIALGCYYAIISMLLVRAPERFHLVGLAAAVPFPIWRAAVNWIVLTELPPLQQAFVASAIAPWQPIAFVLLFLLCRLPVALWLCGPVFVLLMGSFALPLLQPTSGGPPSAPVVELVVNTAVANVNALVVMIGFGLLRHKHSTVRARVRHLEHAATTDPLTGLLSRRAMRERLAAMTEPDAEPSPAGDTLVMLDLDGFKRINDRHGHLIGDEVIRLTGRVLQAEVDLGPAVIASRWGGEEFLLVGVGHDVAQARALAERLRLRMAACAWPCGLAVTASFGVAPVHPSGSMVQAIAQVDQMLYRAKAAGRDRVVCEGDETLAEPASDRDRGPMALSQ